MWEQFKKRVLGLMSSEEDRKEEKLFEHRDPINKDQLQTRMTYKYPSDNSFHFPVIPDTPVRREKNVKSKECDSFSHREESRTKKSLDTTVHKQVDKKPFQPTDVPSPVYGFQRRPNTEDTIDVPAFIRKGSRESLRSEGEHEEVFEDLSQKITDESIESNDSNLIASYDVIEETENGTKDDVLHNSDFNGLLTSKYTELDHEEMDIEEAQPITNVFATKETREPIADEKRKEQNEEEQHKQKVVPFNVIMRPSDKKMQLVSNTKTVKSPPIHLLNDPIERSMEDSEWVSNQKDLLTTTLKHFHVRAKVVNAMSGPAVTRFEIQPEPGVKVSKIKNLSDDIKLNMAAKDIRMEAPIPGKNTIGIEVPNPKSQPVMLQEIVETEFFRKGSSPLSVALGLDIAGRPMVTDIKKMPHGLIAGATGSGKSVCINTILVSLLYKASHDDVRFLLIDPKMVELAPYNDLPHLVAPVITDVKAATSALKWAVAEMEERYEKFVQEGARDIDRYNQKMVSQGRIDDKLPYLVIVIDELADLMMVSPQDVEDAICRIAQKARACGIHLLLATQRPSVDVITGLIKANIPTRIAFSVSSQVDSRTILDTSGAEKLLGKGDMLFVENGVGQPIRIQGAFVSDEEIERVTNYVKKLAPPNYLFEQEELLRQITVQEDEDELYGEAVEFVVGQNGASASLLQRRFKVGYNRAARLIDNMEANGIISEQKGSKPRDVLITQDELETYLFNQRNNNEI